MKKIIDTLANPFCVIRPLTVDYNLIEVSDGKCLLVSKGAALRRECDR